MSESPPRCVMGNEHTLGKASGLQFDDVAVASHGAASYAFWSDAAGLFASKLDATGKTLIAARRVGERCVGGVAAHARASAVELACVRPFVSEGDGTGVASLLSFDNELRLQRQRVLGEAGRVSHGVEMALSDDDQLAITWQDATLDGAQLWLWRGGDEAELLTLSSSASIAGEPTVTWLGKRLFLAWSEASRDQNDRGHRLVLSRGQGAAFVVATLNHETPMPRLRALGGELYLAFRDRRAEARRAGLYISKVSDQGKLQGELTRLSRADAKAGPALVPCFDGMLAIAPRTFGGGKFVGINWADRSLRRTSQERQFYEDSRQFSLAAGTCRGDHALLLIGEQGGPARPDVHLRAVDFRCH